jgi:TetR/AcrR family hemagglutinin/protease transcriptional regulator
VAETETIDRPRRRLSRDERRSELLGHAVRVFAKRGIDGARHAEIAEEAGVSVATTFVYFPTRADLVREVLGEVARIYVDLTTDLHDSTEPVPQVLVAHARSFSDSIRSHPDHALVWLGWSTAVRGETWALYLEFQQRVIDAIADTIRRGVREGSIATNVDPEETARLCIAGAHMIAQLELTGGSAETIERFVRTLVRAIGIEGYGTES